MNSIASKLEERLAPLTKRIEKLEQCLTLEGINAIAERCAEEDDIARQLDALASLAMQAGSVFSRKVQRKLQSVGIRLAALPSVPRIEVIQLVQSILALNPVVLITDDTMNEQQRPELTRILLMELTEVPCFDYQFPSFSQKDKELRAIDEIAGIHEAKPLPGELEEAWTELQKVLHGRYVVAFHLSLVQVQFAVTAEEYGLSIPMLVGCSLLDLLLKYARVKDPIGGELSEDAQLFSDTQLRSVLAEEDVTPFEDSASTSADQRALHLVHALQAMANGTFSLQEPLPRLSLAQFAVPF